MGDKLDKLRQQFRNMDEDNSGALDTRELKKGLEQFNFGLHDREIDRVVGTLGASPFIVAVAAIALATATAIHPSPSPTISTKN